MKKQLVLGIMSGTSLGSVDYALCEISGRNVQLKELWAVDYPSKLQRKLHEAAKGSLNSWEFCQLHHDLGRFYASHALRGKLRPQLVGLHGQTVFHNPSERNPATFQLGESAYLVEKLRAPVVNNFRAADLAAGGQGAPLATIFHEYAFAERGKHICVNNLGGISNVTSLNWRNKKAARPEIFSFDTGPANMLIDFAMRHFSNGKAEFDRNGSWSARGKVNEALLERWLKHSFFHKAPPKSTGREMFGEPFFTKAISEMRGMGKFDVVATLTELTARSLVLNYNLHLGAVPNQVILTGGGASNPVLKQRIADAFGNGANTPQVITSIDHGWPVEAIEAAAFALLAYLRVQKIAGNIAATTGAHRPVLCGTLSDA